MAFVMQSRAKMVPRPVALCLVLLVVQLGAPYTVQGSDEEVIDDNGIQEGDCVAEYDTEPEVPSVVNTAFSHHNVNTSFGRPAYQAPRFGHLKWNEDTCSKFMDYGIITGMRQQLTERCNPFHSREQIEKQGGFSLKCALSGAYCHARNLRIDFSTLKPNGPFYQLNRPGTVSGNCKEIQMSTRERTIPVGFSWLPSFTGFTHTTKSLQDDCDVIIDQPTLIFSRDNQHYFHSHCDFVAAFMTLKLGNLDTTQGAPPAQVVLLDRMTDAKNGQHKNGRWHEIWDTYTNAPVRKAQDFGTNKVCFRDAHLAHLGRPNFIYTCGDVWPCDNSTLLRDYRQFILRRLQENRKADWSPVHLPSTLPAGQTARARILFTVRGLKPHRPDMPRRIINQERLFKLMQERYHPEGVDVMMVDFASVPWTQQLEMLQQSDIFVGVHGAGFTNVLYLPDNAVVVELFNVNMGIQTCYRNFARWMGFSYLQWINPFEENSREYTGRAARSRDNTQGSMIIDEEQFIQLMDNAVSAKLTNRRIEEYAK